jgi:hypothetical protein
MKIFVVGIFGVWIFGLLHVVSRWYREFLLQSWHGSRQPTHQENDTLLS